DLDERLQHEPALAEPRVRDDQAGFLNHPIAEQDQIQVERARRVRRRPLPPALLLDPEERVEELARRQLGKTDRRGVEIHRLRSDDAERHRRVIARDSEMPEQAAKAGHRVIEVRDAVAEIAAEGNGYSIQRDGSTSPCEGPSTSARR